MSEILDRGSLLFASLAVLAASWLTAAPGSLPFYFPLLILAAIYVPFLLATGRLFGFTTDYGTLLTSSAMAWAASQVPLIAARMILPDPLWVWVFPPVLLYFTILMFLAVRNVFGMDNGPAAGTVALSWISLLVLPFILPIVGIAFRWLASPFFLFYAWYFLGGELGNVGAGMRNRQHFRRILEASAVNPHDGDAQYQLGLIYQQRRRYPEAIAHFQKAVAIDPTQTDAHFQLGRILREQGRLAEALKQLETAAEQDPRHSSSEILRELGGTRLELGNSEEAKLYLEAYLGRREYDPEGLYYYGQVLERLGDSARAHEMYNRAVEAARTAPRYRRRFTAKWSRLAQRARKRLG